MKYVLLFSLILGASIIYSIDQNELTPIVSHKVTHITITVEEQCPTCWCKPVPCWQGQCEEQYPTCCLSVCNKKADRKINKVFYPGGPWDKSDDPIKACLVNYLKKNNTSTLTCIGTVPILVLVGALFGDLCWQGCSNSEPPCDPIMECLLPYECNDNTPFCCCSNAEKDMLIAGSSFISSFAAPFCGYGLDKCCIAYLRDPANWSETARKNTGIQSLELTETDESE